VKKQNLFEHSTNKIIRKI